MNKQINNSACNSQYNNIQSKLLQWCLKIHIVCNCLRLTIFEAITRKTTKWPNFCFFYYIFHHIFFFYFHDFIFGVCSMWRSSFKTAAWHKSKETHWNKNYRPLPSKWLKMIIIKRGRKICSAMNVRSVYLTWMCVYVELMRNPRPHIYYLFHFLLCGTLLPSFYFISFLSYDSTLSLKQIHILSCFCCFVEWILFFCLSVCVVFFISAVLLNDIEPECVCVPFFSPARMKNGHWLRWRQIILKSASYHIRNMMPGLKKNDYDSSWSSAATVTTYFIYYMIIPSGVHHSYFFFANSWNVARKKHNRHFRATRSWFAQSTTADSFAQDNHCHKPNYVRSPENRFLIRQPRSIAAENRVPCSNSILDDASNVCFFAKRKVCPTLKCYYYAILFFNC